MRLDKIVQLLQQAYEEDLSLEVVYTNANGDTNEFTIWDVEPDSEYGNGKIHMNGYITAYCGYKDNEEYNDNYTFKISRFEDIIIRGEDDDEDDGW